MTRVEQWIKRMPTGLRMFLSGVAYLGGFYSGAFLLLYMKWQRDDLMVKTAEFQAQATEQVTAATRGVHAEIREMARETTRAQQLAIRVGVATTILGAVVGGFAGAFAAKIVGS